MLKILILLKKYKACNFNWKYYALHRYVSRVNMRDDSNHVILGTQQFKPTEFATQINLNMDNAWGILRCVIDLCMKQPDGKYLILRDPNKVDFLFYGTSYKFTLTFCDCANYMYIL